MDLVLNDQQRLICHKNLPNQLTNNATVDTSKAARRNGTAVRGENGIKIKVIIYQGLGYIVKEMVS